jgi:hypothetical protein
MRHFALATTLLAACSGSNRGNPAADAPIDTHVIDAPIDTPAIANHTHYIIDKVTVPETSAQATQLGLDLNNDGTVDNALGNVFATLKTQGQDVQPNVTTAIDHGDVLLLVDVGETDFTTSNPAEFVTFSGANPLPAPCNGTADTICRHHLDGTGTFDLSPTTWHDTPIVGAIANGTLTAGPGHVTVGFPLIGTQVIQVTLIGARTKVSGLSAAGITTGILGGAVTKTDIDGKVIPAVAAAFEATVMAACPGAPPGCGCPTGSSAATLITLFDTNHDCTISTDEVASNTLVQALLKTDVNIEGQDAISLGVGFTAVKGTYTVSGE